MDRYYSVPQNYGRPPIEVYRLEGLETGDPLRSDAAVRTSTPARDSHGCIAWIALEARTWYAPEDSDYAREARERALEGLLEAAGRQYAGKDYAPAVVTTDNYGATLYGRRTWEATERYRREHGITGIGLEETLERRRQARAAIVGE